MALCALVVQSGRTGASKPPSSRVRILPRAPSMNRKELTMKAVMLIILVGMLMLVPAGKGKAGGPTNKVSIKGKINFSTDRWDLDSCPDSLPGFHVIKRKDNKKLIFSCGQAKMGTEVLIKITSGI